MKPTCQDFVFARDGGTGRSPTEEAIIDYIDRAEEVALPSPAVEREIVAGSTWRGLVTDTLYVVREVRPDRVLFVDCSDEGVNSLDLFKRGPQRTYAWVSDPQPASPDARPLEAPLSDDDLARIDAVRDRVMAFAKSHDDMGVIRAAEGVALEPGEYEVVEISIHDVRPCVAIGDLVKIDGLKRASGTPPYWRIGGPHDLSLVTAVRRVQEQTPQLDDAPGPVRVPDPTQEIMASRYAAGETMADLRRDYNVSYDAVPVAIRVTLAYLFDQYEKLTKEPEQAPQAEAATGELYVPKRREQCRVVAVHPIDAQRVSIGDVLTCCYEADSKIGGATGSFAGYVLVYDVKKIIGVWCRVEPITEPIAPATPPDGSHLIDGEFQSDKYPATPRGKVPLSVKDVTAQDLLWEYAQRRRKVDAQFADDLETALRTAGFAPATPRGVDLCDDVDCPVHGANECEVATRCNERLTARITHLEASLETARFELSNGVSVMNVRQEHDRARIAELTAQNERLKAEWSALSSSFEQQVAAVERERDELLSDATQHAQRMDTANARFIDTEAELGARKLELTGLRNGQRDLLANLEECQGDLRTERQKPRIAVEDCDHQPVFSAKKREPASASEKGKL